jgi:L-idonate 5-dehydrogenase
MRYPKRASPLGHRYLGSASVVPHVQGGFQEYLVVTVERCLRMPKTMSFGEAAFVEPLAVALHGIRRAGSLLGRSLLITGCGPIGLLMMLAAKVAGARRVAVTDILEEPLKLARRLGADEVINVGTGDGAVEALAEDKGRMDVAIEASGSVQALETCLRCVRPGGRLVQVGNLPLGKHSVSLNAVMAKELDYVGALRFDREFAWAGEYLARGLIDVKPLLTRRYPLGEAVEAFEFAGDRRHACKVQLTVP